MIEKQGYGPEAEPATETRKPPKRGSRQSPTRQEAKETADRKRRRNTRTAKADTIGNRPTDGQKANRPRQPAGSREVGQTAKRWSNTKT